MAKESRREFLALAGVGTLAGLLHEAPILRGKDIADSHSSPAAFTLGIASVLLPRIFP